MRNLSRLVVASIAALLLFAGCDGDDGARRDSNIASGPDASSADPDEYFAFCSMIPDSCGSPYACTTLVPAHEDHPTGDVCLVPCDSQGDCPDIGLTCICKGVSGQTDGPAPEGHCDCGF